MSFSQSLNSPSGKRYTYTEDSSPELPITNRVTDLSRSVRTVPRRVSQLYRIPQVHLWSVRTSVKMTKRYTHVKRNIHLRCICIRHSSKEAARTLCSVIYLRYMGWRINIILNSFFRLDEVDLGRIIEKQRVYIYTPRAAGDVAALDCVVRGVDPTIMGNDKCTLCRHPEYRVL